MSNITRHINLCTGREHERTPQAATIKSFIEGADNEFVSQENYEQRTLDVVVDCGVSFNVLEHDTFRAFAVRLAGFGTR